MNCISLIIDNFYYFKEKDKRNIFINSDSEDWDASEFLWKYFEECDSKYIRDRLSYIDICTQLPEEFLMMTDRFSMAHSLEARTPFLETDPLTGETPSSRGGRHPSCR